jgi:hypothetical protein
MSDWDAALPEHEARVRGFEDAYGGRARDRRMADHPVNGPAYRAGYEHGQDKAVLREAMRRLHDGPAGVPPQGIPAPAPPAVDYSVDGGGALHNYPGCPGDGCAGCYPIDNAQARERGRRVGAHGGPVDGTLAGTDRYGAAYLDGLYEGRAAALEAAGYPDQAAALLASRPAPAERPADRSWPGLLGDDRLTGAERKRLAEDAALANDAQLDPDDNSPHATVIRTVAEEVRQARAIEVRRALYANAEAVGQPPLDAAAGVEQILTAQRPQDLGLAAARMYGADLHRAAQLLGVSSLTLPADDDDQRVRDMLVSHLLDDRGVWMSDTPASGAGYERDMRSKVARRERDLTRLEAQHAVDGPAA